MEQVIKDYKNKVKQLWVDMTETEEERINKELREKVVAPVREYINSCEHFINENQRYKSRSVKQ